MEVNIPDPIGYIRQRSAAFRALAEPMRQQHIRALKLWDAVKKSGRHPQLADELAAQVNRIYANRQSHAAWVGRLDTVNATLAKHKLPTLGDPITVSTGTLIGIGVLLALATGMYVVFSNYQNEGKALDVRAKLAEAVIGGTMTPEQYNQGTQALDEQREKDRDNRRTSDFTNKVAIGLGAGLFAALVLPKLMEQATRGGRA